jgi:hypothetical protein
MQARMYGTDTVGLCAVQNSRLITTNLAFSPLSIFRAPNEIHVGTVPGKFSI